MIKLKSLLLEKTLYHGTIIDNIESIKKYGLVPSVGAFTSKFYDELEPQELTFAADKDRLDVAVTAATQHIAHKLNKDFHSITDAEFIKYAAIVKIEDGEEYYNYNDPKDARRGIDHPYSTEPGDYYSEENIGIDGVYTGNALIKLLRKYNLFPRTYGIDKLKKSGNYKKDYLIKYLINRHPTKSKEELVSYVNKFDDKTINQYYNKYNIAESTISKDYVFIGYHRQARERGSKYDDIFVSGNGYGQSYFKQILDGLNFKDRDEALQHGWIDTEILDSEHNEGYDELEKEIVDWLNAKGYRWIFTTENRPISIKSYGHYIYKMYMKQKDILGIFDDPFGADDIANAYLYHINNPPMAEFYEYD